jgi:DNA-binding NarL/FixJ family response regulator
MKRHPRIAVCDPNEISRLGIAQALEDHGFAVVGVAGGCEATAALLKRGLDVLLVDVSVPAFDDLVASARDAGCVVIGTGTTAGSDLAFAGLRAGAVGYLTKDLPAKAWAEAVRASMRGEAPLSRAMTTQLIEAYRGRLGAHALAALAPTSNRLTTREWEILAKVADGKTNRAVAEELCISVETVRTHVSSILTKLGTPNRSAAAVKYHQLVAI